MFSSRPPPYSSIKPWYKMLLDEYLAYTSFGMMIFIVVLIILMMYVI